MIPLGAWSSVVLFRPSLLWRGSCKGTHAEGGKPNTNKHTHTHTHKYIQSNGIHKTKSFLSLFCLILASLIDLSHTTTPTATTTTTTTPTHTHTHPHTHSHTLSQQKHHPFIHFEPRHSRKSRPYMYSTPPQSRDLQTASHRHFLHWFLAHSEKLW